MRVQKLASRLWFLLALALAGASGCRGHTQLDGPYAFTADEIIRDDCSLLATPDALWDGTLDLRGNELAMLYGLFDTQLAGRYLDGLEEFTLDGSTSAVQLTVGGVECVADLLTVHLEGKTSGPKTFEGVLRVSTQGSTACTCALWTTFRAVQP